MVSEQPEGVVFDDIISKNVTIRLRTEDGDQRYFNGHVSRLTHTQMHMNGSLTHYKAVMVPWLWFLTRTADCRIFQDMTVPNIIKQVFRDHGYSDIEDALSGEYRTWNYCVQYRETAFNFVSRLMEQEGIYYFFSHESDKHKLVLADSSAAHDDIAGSATLPYHPPMGGKINTPHVSEWTLDRELLPGTYAVSDFDFTSPKKQLRTKAFPDHEYTVADGEFYDSPGEYTDYSHAESYSKIRVEELHAGVEVTRCRTDARTISVGFTYELTDYPLDDHNKKYLVTAASYELTSDIVKELDATSDDPLYRCRFSAIDAERQFRSARTTPRPHIRGPQTAIVVGPDDTEIHTDEYGRVKVQFHWDHEGKSDANSSCWVRVSQNWAGNKWGGMFIPHKGQEVIVDFLEGDPDRPIITGRVYNADNMPPDFENESGEKKGLPDNKHKSIIRDDYGNEMIFDATPDDEHIRIHSPHHQSTLELGKSVKCETESNSFTFTHGNKNEIIAGVQAEFAMGMNVEAFVGWNLGFTLASKTEINIGIEKSLNVGPRLSYCINDEVELAYGDFKQQVKEEIVLDSEKAAYMIGGPANNGQMRLDPATGIVISYSAIGSERANRVGDKKLMVTLGALGAVGSLGAAVSGALACDLDDPVFPILFGTESAAFAATSIAYDVLLAKMIKEFQEGPPPQHSEPDTQIQMDEFGLTIESGESSIEIKHDGSIDIKSKGKLSITSEAGFDLKSTGPMSVGSDAKVNLKGIFTHKNMNILE